MEFYSGRKQYYCGVDLHTKSMYLCVLDREGDILVHRQIGNDAEMFERVLAPYRDDLAVGAECIFCWYWLADLCEDLKIDFVLGHALYMSAIHGGKAKNDRIDAEKIGRLLQSGLFPKAYVYPRKLRWLRDLLRRRSRFTRLRAQLLVHLHQVNAQCNLPDIGHATRLKGKRQELDQLFSDRDLRTAVRADLDCIKSYDIILVDLERYLRGRAKQHYRKELQILRTVPGIGVITAMTILFETGSMDRFASCQKFASYCRLVKCTKESGGKRYGTSGRKIGNAHLKWAFSEAAVHAIQYSERISKYVKKLESKHGKGKAKSLLAHKIGRAVYHMLKKDRVFDEDRFLGG